MMFSRLKRPSSRLWISILPRGVCSTALMPSMLNAYFSGRMSACSRKTEGDIAAVQLADDARPHGIIAVDDRPVVAAELFEQGELGLEIVLHGAVKIQVVAGEGGEHRLGEGDVVDAVQAERGRGDLHDQVRAAGLDRVGHEGEQLGGFRRGQLRRPRSGGETHAQGADGGGGGRRRAGPGPGPRWSSCRWCRSRRSPPGCREGSSKKRLAMALSARRSFLTCTQVTCGYSAAGGWIETTAAAPRATASPT